MSAYVHPRWTRIVIAPSVNNLAAPTLAEVNAGSDVSADVLIDGLTVDRDQDFADVTPWAGNIAVQRPARYGISVDLVGLRRTAGSTETLWDLAADLRSAAVLLIRRGVPLGTAFADGQKLDALRFRWGKRSVISSSGGAVTFRVPLAVYEDEDEAVITS